VVCKEGGKDSAILILTDAQALQVLLPLLFAFVVIPMLGLPNQVVELFERFTLVLVILFVGIDGLRTLPLVEAKRDELWQRLFRA
jgi:hypothetical protein